MRVSAPEDEVLFWNLKRWGAPLSKKGLPGLALSLEETLAYACGLARRNPSVAMVWPVVFATHRGDVDLAALAALARQLGLARVVGFLLRVSACLLSDAGLRRYAERFKDRRSRRPEQFFRMGQGRLYRELTERNTPREARTWGFRMNTSIDDFRACFDKFVGTHATLRQ